MLLPAAGGGQVPAAELLMLQYGARQHIRRNTLHQLHQEITVTRKYGSFTLEDCLAKLVAKGQVERAVAALRVNHPDEFESSLRSAGG
jgi:Tfp pilus assembly pilus retraction ATPase PilT